ncbi:hypothetical protein HDU96_000430 [Phlyctochytrium bullatum]|nr:hypothetical protein HDU96_000430 [Phlyctochytrium bullatum]
MTRRRPSYKLLSNPFSVHLPNKHLPNKLESQATVIPNMLALVPVLLLALHRVHASAPLTATFPTAENAYTITYDPIPWRQHAAGLDLTTCNLSPIVHQLHRIGVRGEVWVSSYNGVSFANATTCASLDVDSGLVRVREGEAGCGDAVRRYKVALERVGTGNFATAVVDGASYIYVDSGFTWTSYQQVASINSQPVQPAGLTDANFPTLVRWLYEIKPSLACAGSGTAVWVGSWNRDAYDESLYQEVNGTVIGGACLSLAFPPAVNAYVTTESCGKANGALFRSPRPKPKVHEADEDMATRSRRPSLHRGIVGAWPSPSFDSNSSKTSDIGPLTARSVIPGSRPLSRSSSRPPSRVAAAGGMPSTSLEPEPPPMAKDGTKPGPPPRHRRVSTSSSTVAVPQPQRTGGLLPEISHTATHNHSTAKEESIPVTLDTSIVLQRCRPLPEDIAALDDADTACTYCGVSYLLLSKYERLVKHVSRVEEEMERLRGYAADQPVLTSRVMELEGVREEQKGTIEELEKEAARMKEEQGKTVRALHELQLRHTRLTHEMETAMQNSSWLEEGLRSQLRLLARKMLDITEVIQEHRRDLANARADVEKRFVFFLVLHVLTSANLLNSSRLAAYQTTLLTDLAAHLRDKLPAIVASRLNPQLAAAARSRAALEEEVRTLKDDLQDAVARGRRAEGELESAKDEFEGMLEVQRVEMGRERARVEELEERCGHMEGVVADLRAENAKLQASERSLRDRLEDERAAAEKEILYLRTRQSELDARIKEKEAEMASLKESFDSEKRLLAQSETSAVDMANRAVAQKDVAITKLTAELRDLQKTISSLQTERTKTIEAHQSRIQHLQSHFQEQLRTAGADQAEAARAEMRAAFDREREEAVRAMKEMFGKQLAEVRGELRAQVDAARLARDKAWKEAANKAGEVEEEWKAKLQKAEMDKEMLKGTIAYLQKELAAIKSAPPLPTPPPQPAEPSPPPPQLAELKAEIARRDAEIGFLKETVRVECEERMGLLATLDALRRGAKPAVKSYTVGDLGGAEEDKVGGVAGKKAAAKPREKKQGGAPSSVPAPAAGQPPPEREERRPEDPELNLYQSMASAAALKKAIKLRSAARVNKSVQQEARPARLECGHVLVVQHASAPASGGRVGNETHPAGRCQVGVRFEDVVELFGGGGGGVGVGVEIEAAEEGVNDVRGGHGGGGLRPGDGLVEDQDEGDVGREEHGGAFGFGSAG